MNDQFIVPAVAERLLSFLQQRDNRHALVFGSIGSGKTSTLAYVAQQLKESGSLVEVLSASDEPSVDMLVAKIARKLDVDNSLTSSDVRSLQGSLNLRKTLQKLRQLKKPTFLFIDDLDAVQEQSSLYSLLDNLLVDAHGSVRIVLASRSNSTVSRLQRLRNVNSFEVAQLGLTEATNFLNRAVGESIPHKNLSQLLKLADGNPLVLKLIAEVVRQHGTDTFFDQLIQEESLTEQVLSNYVFALKTRTEVEKALLSCLAVLEIATTQQLLAITGVPPQEAKEALDSLSRASLIVQYQSDWCFSHKFLFNAALINLFPLFKLEPKDLSFGAEAAENDTLLESHFVAPPDLSQIISGHKTIILGDRGTGKSAVFRSLGELKTQATVESAQSNVIIALSKDPAAFVQKFNARDGGASSADRFKALWLLFCATLAARDVHSRLLHTADGKRYASIASKLLRRVGWAADIREESKLRRVWEIAKSFLPQKVSFSAGPVTIEPEWLRSETISHRGGMEIDDFIDRTDKVLTQHNTHLLIVVDQIDELYKYDRNTQEAMMQGLLSAESYLSQKKAIRLTALLRTDLYEVYDIQEKNKFVSRTAKLKWNWQQIMLQMLGRAFANKELRTISSAVTTLGVMSDTIEFHLRVLFPALIEGKQIQDWLQESLKNGRGDVAPRQIVLFLNFLKQRALGNRCRIPVFSETELIAAMLDVSESAFEEVVNDFRVAVSFVRNCKSGKISSFRTKDVEKLFDTNEGTINQQIELLERLGFLARDIISDNGLPEAQFSVPRLYSRCW